MKLKSLHEALLGDWSGEKSLWFDPKAAPHAVCASTLSVYAEALGQFLALRYRWSVEPGYVMPVQQAPISKPRA